MKKFVYVVLTAITCVTAKAQNPSMVKDINPNISISSGSSPLGVVVSDGVAYFSATTELYGRELWRSDGTDIGTYLLKDIRLGEENSSPGNLFTHNGIVYFSANDGIHGQELWKTDGTEEGTVMIKDINPGYSGSSPESFAFMGKIFFSAYSAGYGTELWYTDGTEQNTHVLDLNIGSGSSNPDYFTASGGNLFFAANNGVNGYELWKTDGSTGNTVMVKDINPSGNGINSITGPYFTDVDGILYFKGNDGVNGDELWTSNGTASKTAIVEDIYVGSSSSPHSLVNIDGTCYFACIHPTYGYELWKSDGDAASTDIILNIRAGTLSSNPRHLINANGRLYFVCDDGTGYDLWTSDGSGINTEKVADITSFNINSPISYVNNRLYFEADNSLWISDGTSPGTIELKTDCYNTTFSILPLNGSLGVFRANSSVHGYELWVTDGSTPGTDIVQEIGINYDRFDSPGTMLYNYNNNIYFDGFDGDDLIGHELWMSDGTEVNTQLVGNTNTTNNKSLFPKEFKTIGDTIYFVGDLNTSGQGIHKYYHTDAVATPLTATNTGIALYTVMNEQLFMVLLDSLYAFDPKTSSNNFLLKKSNMSDIVAGNNIVYFKADGTTDMAIWKSDGTIPGTEMVKDGFSTSIYSPKELTVFDSILFFSGNVGSGYNMWWSDGSETGTELFNSEISSCEFMRRIGNDLYFTAFIDGDYTLCKKTKATFSNNQFDIVYPFQEEFAILDGLLYKNEFFFFIEKQRQFQQLWKSDGTNEGTNMVAEINSELSNEEVGGYTEYNGILYFSAFANGKGRRLWRTDGTEEGTYIISDTSCLSKTDKTIEVSNDMLFFIGDDGTHGASLWKYECKIRIDDHSNSENICVNDTVKLIVYASSTYEPLSYQWQFFDNSWIDLNDDSNISGAHCDSINISNAEISHDGDYRCIVIGECGYDTTDIITLTVNALPSVRIQDENTEKIICPNTDVEISAAGAINYSWTGSGVLQASDQTTTVNISTDSSLIVIEGTDVIGCAGYDTILLRTLKPYSSDINALITVDPVSGKNMMVWNKPYKEGIYSFNVSRGLQTSPTLLDNVFFQDYNRYIDFGSNPKQNYEDYYITITDTCGSTTDIIEHHRPIHLQVNINTVAQPNEVNLSWNEYVGFEYDSFYIYRGADTTNLEFVQGIPHNAPPFTYTEELEGSKIYYRIAVNAPEVIFLEGNKKANNGPFSRSLSNMEDNRQQGTNSISQTIFNKLKIYPNPMISNSIISIPNNGIYQLSIYDLTGKLIKMENEIFGPSYKIERDNLDAGMYIIELQGDKTYKTKLIVQ